MGIDNKGYISYSLMFPEEEELLTKLQRASTPDFWKIWCRQNNIDPEQAQRNPRWHPSTSEKKLQILTKACRSSDEAADKRKWISTTMRRLKSRGKSDARCREIVAHHLPRGTGPRDREDVNTFSTVDVQTCRKVYSERVLHPVRNIEKVVIDMRNQNQILKASRENLMALNMDPHRPRLDTEVYEELKSAWRKGS